MMKNKLRSKLLIIAAIALVVIGMSNNQHGHIGERSRFWKPASAWPDIQTTLSGDGIGNVKAP